MHYVLVAGSRGYKRSDAVEFELSRRIHSRFDPEYVCIVQGGCKNSPDETAKDWAEFNEIPYLTWPSRWKFGRLGRNEGPVRNQRMAIWVSSHKGELNSNEFLGFWDGESRGTLTCLKEVIEAGMPYKLFDSDGVQLSRDEIHKALFDLLGWSE